MCKCYRLCVDHVWIALKLLEYIGPLNLVLHLTDMFANSCISNVPKEFWGRNGSGQFGLLCSLCSVQKLDSIAVHG